MHVTCMSRAPGESKGSGPQAAAGGAKAATVEEHGRTEAVNFALSDLRSIKEVSKGKRYVVQTNRLAAMSAISWCMKYYGILTWTLRTQHAQLVPLLGILYSMYISALNFSKA